jgi:hypothetical protein
MLGRIPRVHSFHFGKKSMPPKTAKDFLQEALLKLSEQLQDNTAVPGTVAVEVLAQQIYNIRTLTEIITILK